MKRCLPWSLILCGVLWAGAVGADDSALLMSGGLASAMQEHPSVRMVTAVITAEVHDEYSLVQCDFVFRNEGAATTVEMGFPSVPGEALVDQSMAPPLQAFHSWVDGQEVTTRQVRGAQTDPTIGRTRWHVKEVSFAAGQERTVRDSYRQPNGVISTGEQWFPYALQSGASWHGPIGSLQVTVRWVERWDWVPEPRASNREAKVRGGGPQWEMLDSRTARLEAHALKPTYDLSFQFRPVWDRVTEDGFPLETFGFWRGARVESQETYLAAQTLAQVLGATLGWDEAKQTALLTLRDQRRLAVTAGSPRLLLGAHEVAGNEAAPYVSHGTEEGEEVLWVPVTRLLGERGMKITASREDRTVKITTGGPVAWEAEVWGPERDLSKESLYLVRQNGVLEGELRALVNAIPGAKLPSENEHASYSGWQGDVRITVPRRAAPPAHDLRLRWGKTAAWLDGKLIQLPVAPFISPADTGMVPVEAVCEAFGLTSAYDEEKKLLTISAP